jgi:DNA-binding MarR family transcriptional regulator
MPPISDPHDVLVALLQVQIAMERRSDAFFLPYGLTSAQFNILNLLGYSDGRMDQAALVDSLLVGKSSISIVLNRMVRDAYVKREEHAQDRRQVVLVLTAKGRALWRKIAPTYEEGVKQIFGALPASRRKAFLADLQVLQKALDRSTD